MNKKLSILLTIFMVSVLSLTGCKKDAAKDAVKGATKDAHKLTGDVKAHVKKGVDGVKTTVKDVKANAKVAVNKIAGMNFASKLDLSYFPEKAVLVGSVDIKKFLSIEILKPLLKEGLEKAKKEGIEIDKATFASWYMNVEDLAAENPEVAGIISNFTLPAALLTKNNVEVKKESYNGVDMLVNTKDNGGYVILGNDTLMGSIDALKKIIDAKKGKTKNLASAATAKDFKDIMAKTGDSALRIAFVPNAVLSAKIKEASKEGQAAMFAEFINNFKAASFGIGVTDKEFTFSINVKSSKAGIDMVMAMIKPQLGMLQQDNSPMLAMTEQFLGKDGLKMLQAVVKTIKVTNDGEYLAITFNTKFEYWLQAPAIFGQAMGKMYQK